jgi:hypothetical protein
MSDTQQLETIRTATLDQIEEIRADPKPTYWLDGQRVHWQEYVESLQATVDWCDQKILQGELFEVRSRGTS